MVLEGGQISNIHPLVDYTRVGYTGTPKYIPYPSTPPKSSLGLYTLTAPSSPVSP